MLLAAVTAVTMMFAGSVTAGAITVIENPDGSARVSYDSGDWYVVYDPSTSWVSNTGGTMSASLFRKVLEIHMPEGLYESCYEQVSEGKIFEIVAGNADICFAWHLFPGYTYNAFFVKVKDGETYNCFESSEAITENVDGGEFSSEKIIKLLLSDDCPDFVIQCLESGFKSEDFSIIASCFEDFGKPGIYFLNNEKVSYSVRDKSPEESASSQTALKKTTLTAKRSGNKIKLSWKKVDGAEKYQIYYREKGESKYKRLVTVSGSKTSYSTSKLDKSKTYQFKIRSYAESNGEKIYSKFSKVKTVDSK